MGRITDTVKGILIINIIFFIGSSTLGDRAFEWFALWFPKNDNFQIWQLVSHMFMHGGTGHIFFNMFALYMFGSHLENSIGQKKFLFIYFFSGFGAAGFQLLFSYFQFGPGYQQLVEQGFSNIEIRNIIINGYNSREYLNYPEIMQNTVEAYVTPMVGASGAIFGVLAAFAVLYPNLPLYIMFIPVPIKAKYLIGGYFLLDLYGGITGQAILGPSNVAHWAHIGGAVIGFITMWYWKKNSFNNKRWY